MAWFLYCTLWGTRRKQNYLVLVKGKGRLCLCLCLKRSWTSKINERTRERMGEQVGVSSKFGSKYKHKIHKASFMRVLVSMYFYPQRLIVRNRNPAPSFLLSALCVCVFASASLSLMLQEKQTNNPKDRRSSRKVQDRFRIPCKVFYLSMSVSFSLLETRQL